MVDIAEARKLAEHLDAINRRVEERGPTPNSAARMAQIMADHEASCAELRLAEADEGLDTGRPAAPASVR